MANFVTLPTARHGSQVPQLNTSYVSASSSDAAAKNAALNSKTGAKSKQTGYGVSDLMKAVNSIPAYVERCSHFFVICPTVMHRDLPGVACDYGSWLQRGWCRVEHVALALARHNEMPAIAVKGGDAAPFLLPLTSAMHSAPGMGDFTCVSVANPTWCPTRAQTSASPYMSIIVTGPHPILQVL